MADSDFFSYSSIYSEFSKGPKSIYYGIGDEMLPGAILNVPQTDEDDEWGRTQRISEERTFDYIAKIYKTLFDPYNALPGVGLVPGEAGSELNVAKNMIRLVGRTGIDKGVFDLAVPSLTIGDWVLDGSTNTLSIKNVMSLNSSALKLNTDFNIDSTTNQGKVSYRDVSIVFFDDDNTLASVSVMINGQAYVFDDSGLTLPTGKKLSGELNTKDIMPQSDNSYNIGSSSAKYKEAYFNNAQISTLCGSTIIPASLNTLYIGSENLTDTINIRANSFDVYQSDLIDPVISAKDLGAYLSLHLGTQSVSHEVDIYSKLFRLWTAPSNMVIGANDTFFYVNKDTLPGVPGGPAEVSLGVDGVKFKSLWVKGVFSETGKFTSGLTVRDIYADTADQYKVGTSDTRFLEGHFTNLDTRVLINSCGGPLYLCGEGINFINTYTQDKVMSVGRNSIVTYADIRSINILPNINSTYNIGSDTLSYNSIYTSKTYLKDLYFLDYIDSSWHRVRFMCGSMKTDY